MIMIVAAYPAKYFLYRNKPMTHMQHHQRIKNVVSLLSLGAAETVTGSKHLLQTPELNVLIDCGLFQGIKSLRQKNWEPLPIPLLAIDVVILTHAHLDHCGYIPLLVRKGFKGKIYMTEPTRDLAELILRDSAKIQMEDAERANELRYSKHHPALPLYDLTDVEAALDYFVPIQPHTRITLSENLDFQLIPAGHIMGATSCDLNCFGRAIVFSGDVGRYNDVFLKAPAPIDKADYVILESTYGDRLHEKTDPKEILGTIINKTLQQGGNLLIPSFAVGRAQEIMYLLNVLKKEGAIPEDLPLFLDSPMAASATDILLRYPEWLKISKADCRQMCDDITINRDYQNTARIIAMRKSKVVIASSGMLSGGRVLEYLKHYVTDPRNTILLFGFQAEGTRGRALLDKAYEVKIHGRYYPVKARVAEISSLSAHADQKGLLHWLRTFKAAPRKIYLVHGEPSAQEAFRVKIHTELKIPVHIQKQNEPAVLFNIEKNYLEN